ncbi:MAG: hypothetical protein WBL70_18290 [Candidatus Acidiferrales bacterium]
MYKRSIVVLGMILGSYAPGAAQTTGPKLILARNEVAEIAPTTTFATTTTFPPTTTFAPTTTSAPMTTAATTTTFAPKTTFAPMTTAATTATVITTTTFPPATTFAPTTTTFAPTTTATTTTSFDTTKTFRMDAIPFLSASFLVYQAPDKSTPQFIFLSGAAYEHDPGLESLASLSPMHEVRTTFLTLSSLPLAQLWSGRLRLDGFTSTIHMREVELGPSVASGLEDFRRPRQSDPSGLRSFDVYGVSLSLHFGRGARTAHPVQGWRTLSRLAGSVLQ